LGYFSTLKFEATYFSETSVDFQQNTRNYIPKDRENCLPLLSMIADHSGLRHELTSFARSVRSWVPIPLKACVCVCLFCLCCPVYVAALRRAGPPFKQSYWLS
jgi:hypothetical protein